MIKLIGVYDYTVILTYLSLFSAVFSMIQAMNGNYTVSVLCIFFSGVCDAFDGTVARMKKDRTEDEKSFGIQLDSLVDTVSFGVAPAFLCYCMGVDSLIGLAILMVFCMCGVCRLAFFNVLEMNRQKTEGGCNKAYRGLPITTSSMILPCVYGFRFVIPEELFVGLLHVVMAVTAFLFVLDFTVPKYDFKKPLVKLGLIKE